MVQNMYIWKQIALASDHLPTHSAGMLVKTVHNVKISEMKKLQLVKLAYILQEISVNLQGTGHSACALTPTYLDAKTEETHVV